MENPSNGEKDQIHETEFKRFAAKRVIAGALIMIVVIWIVGILLGYFEKPAEINIAHQPESGLEQVPLTTQSEPASSHVPLEKEVAETTNAQHPYDEDTVGSIMTFDFVALDKGLTAGEAVEYLKKTHQDINQPVHLFVVDSNEKLLGMVSLKQLRFAASDSHLEDFMSTDVMPAKPDLSKENIKNMIDLNHLQMVPVIDNTNRLIGVVKAEKVMRLAQKETGQAVETGPAPVHETSAEAVPHAPAAVQKESSEPLAHGPAPAHKAEVKKPEHPLPAPPEEKATTGHEVTPHETAGVSETKPKAKGVAFVEAAIKPLDYELNERFYGWRPNDILDFTDNVNSFQLGVLEVTRRTVVALTERISRTGATAAFDKNLENSMNWFMVKPDRYWFPSPESKYKAGLHELTTYKEKLEKGEANFYTRPDNLIPLLMAYEDLLGSCEENLVKTKEDDGSAISFFKADDYFYYAQGIASAMGTILEAVHKDFLITVETRRGIEVLQHAIESCHHAAEVDPWLITNSSLSGILANHRANLAAPLSHARFYIGVLIKTLST